MTEEIIIDVSNCSHKRDDDCMEVPICNEYGDLMGYQSCEAQTLCPYRSQKKIEHLEQLKNKYYQQTLDDEITISDLITKCNDLEQENKELGRKVFLAEQNVRTTAATFCEKDNKIIELEQENKELKQKLELDEVQLESYFVGEEKICKENKIYRSALENIQRMILSAWEQGKYLDGGLYECLTKEFSKINGI